MGSHDARRPGRLPAASAYTAQGVRVEGLVGSSACEAVLPA
jgi:hypothetical protein